MYFPYLRGRQYELIGVREGIKSGIISDKIIPVIEPVKLSSTLLSTMRVAIEEKNKIAIICNSNIPSFFDDLESTDNKNLKKEFFELLKSDYIVKSFLVKKSWIEDIEEYKRMLEFSEEELMIICNNKNLINEFEKRYDEQYPRFVLIPDETKFNKRIKNNKILLEDRFEKEERNSDYLKNEDDFFSDDHLEYEENGYIGFSDYVTMGEKYNDGGFAPYAVAIHITYLNEKSDPIKIHHFVSDSNEDIKDPAKKFYEAVEKLNKFEFSEFSKTKALDSFLEHYENGSYPGLGIVKKLSLLHHLELVKNILDKN